MRARKPDKQPKRYGGDERNDNDHGYPGRYWGELAFNKII